VAEGEWPMCEGRSDWVRCGSTRRASSSTRRGASTRTCWPAPTGASRASSPRAAGRKRWLGLSNAHRRACSWLSSASRCGRARTLRLARVNPMGRRNGSASSQDGSTSSEKLAAYRAFFAPRSSIGRQRSCRPTRFFGFCLDAGQAPDRALHEPTMWGGRDSGHRAARRSHRLYKVHAPSPAPN